MGDGDFDVGVDGVDVLNKGKELRFGMTPNAENIVNVALPEEGGGG